MEETQKGKDNDEVNESKLMHSFNMWERLRGYAALNDRLTRSESMNPQLAAEYDESIKEFREAYLDFSRAVKVWANLEEEGGLNDIFIKPGELENLKYKSFVDVVGREHILKETERMKGMYPLGLPISFFWLAFKNRVTVDMSSRLMKAAWDVKVFCGRVGKIQPVAENKEDDEEDE